MKFLIKKRSWRIKVRRRLGMVWLIIPLTKPLGYIAFEIFGGGGSSSGEGGGGGGDLCGSFLKTKLCNLLIPFFR